MNAWKMLRATLYVLVLCSFCVGTTFGADQKQQKQQKQGKIYVVLFAVNKFSQGSGFEFRPLKGAINDMRNLEERWINPQIKLAEEADSTGKRDDVIDIDPLDVKTTFKDAMIVRIYDDDSENPTRPTSENFWNEVKQVVGKADKNDVVYVLVATHGIGIGAKSYLCPEDCKYFERKEGENDEEYAKRRNLISVSELIQLLSKCKGKSVLALDACRNYPDEAPQAEQENYSLKEISELFKEKKYENVVVLTSCSLGQRSHEITEDRQDVGAFFYYLSEGLAGKADLQGAYDGRVTLVEAFNYADAKTRNVVQKVWDRTQTPECFLTSNQFGDVTAALVPSSLTSDDYVENPNDYYFALRCADNILRYEQKETLKASNNGRKRAPKTELDVDRLLTDTFDYTLSVQPSNTTSLYLRGYLRRAKRDYKGALEDFSKADVELKLFVTGMTNEKTGKYYDKGAYSYSSSSVQMSREDSEGRALIFRNGARITVDRIENGRLHVVSYKMEESDSWIDEKFVDWTPVQASSSFNTALSPTVTTGGEQTNIINPPTPNLFNDFN